MKSHPLAGDLDLPLRGTLNLREDLIKVDLPAPFSPATTRTSPGWISRSTPSTALTPENLFEPPQPDDRLRGFYPSQPVSTPHFHKKAGARNAQRAQRPARGVQPPAF